jgi:Secretion system C-terminal sorting domain
MRKVFIVFILAGILCFNGNAQIVQPIRLSEFRGQLSGGDGALNWKTLLEENAAAFDIERSNDGQHFVYVATVAAVGNTSAETHYSYLDKNITALGVPVVYYRLKMKDTDGEFDYTRLIAININNKGAVVMLYPNPVRENATLMISVTRKEKITYSIIDQYGNILQQKNISVNKGSNSVPIESNALAAGVYTLSLYGQFTNTKLKFVKH